MIFRLNKKGKYESLQPQPYGIHDSVSPAAFPKLKINLSKVFTK